jgi:23S rRNA pseudouridine2604 synthase
VLLLNPLTSEEKLTKLNREGKQENYMELMRIKKYLSSAGFCSRRQAEEYIRSGRILVNGKKATLADKVTEKDRLVIDGKKFVKSSMAESQVLIFNKPKGVVCTLTSNPWTKTLLNFDFGLARVFPIGRLETDAHGLLLLTNDGDLGNKLASPSKARDEEYLLILKNTLSTDQITRFKEGVVGGKYKTGPQQLAQVDEKCLRFSLYEGRYKHIRTLCEVAGLEIDDLQRVRIGGIELENLEIGAWKTLNMEQFEALKNKKAERPKRRIVKGGHRGQF